MNLLKYRIKTFFDYKDLMKELVVRDLRLKYRRSFLGYLWSVLNPLLTMIVLTVVFSNILGRNIENYPVYLLTGRTLYDLMKQSTTKAMKSVTGNASLMRKVYVPKYIFTLAKVTSCLVDTVFSLAALLIVMVFTGAKFHVHMLLMPFVLIQLYVFCCGLGFFLAQLNVFFRDTEHIYGVVLTAWLYLTPIIYLPERLSENVRFFVTKLNPLYFYVGQFRSLVYYGQMPSAELVISGCISAAAMLLFGIWMFQRSKDRFILYI